MREEAERSRAVFVDRDGVLNRDSPDYIRTVDQFVLLPGAPEAVARLSQAGFALVVVTNQSGVARGYVRQVDLEAMHARLAAAVREAGGAIDGIYYCPHLPGDGCPCRKPAPGMVRQAAADLGLDLARSFFVGDKADDIRCGKAAGCRTVLVMTGQTRDDDPARLEAAPDHVAADLTAAAEWIIAQPG